MKSRKYIGTSKTMEQEGRGEWKLLELSAERKEQRHHVQYTWFGGPYNMLNLSQHVLILYIYIRCYVQANKPQYRPKWWPGSKRVLQQAAGLLQHNLQFSSEIHLPSLSACSCLDFNSQNSLRGRKFWDLMYIHFQASKSEKHYSVVNQIWRMPS